MTSSPRTKQDIYDSLKNSLKGKITKLTNFTERSFNYVWTQAFAEELRELEVLSLTAELAGFIDYTGGDVEQAQLDELGITDVDAEEINEQMEEQYLDEYLKILDMQRDSGTKAQGTVEIETQSASTNIPKGTVVTTLPDADGDTLDFVTLSDVSTASNDTSVTVDIEATEVGAEYNLPSDTIVRFAEPPVGVLGVTNPNATAGGEARETNEELRERAKEKVRGSGEGGTADGIKQAIANDVDTVSDNDIAIDEFTDQCPPFVDVIIDFSASNESKILDSIDSSRPTGIEHNLVEPQRVFVGVRVNLETGNVGDTTQFKNSMEQRLTNFLDNTAIGEGILQDELVDVVMDFDSEIDNIEFLDAVIESVEREQFIYDDTQTDYRLDFTYEDGDGSITVEDDAGNTYSEGVDFNVKDQTGDGWPETIVWDTTKSTPSDGQTFFVDYDVTTSDEKLIGRQDVQTAREPSRTEDHFYVTDTDEYALDYSFDDNNGTISISDNSGDSYTRGTDYTVEDQNNDGYPEIVVWDTSNSTPDDGEQFTVDYRIAPQDRRGLEQHYVDLVRDETLTWSAGNNQTFKYDNNQDRYTLDHIPAGSVSVEDASGDTYADTDDYKLVDDDGDGFNETVDFSLGVGAVGGSTSPQTPDDGELFTVTYEKAVYPLEFEASGTLDSTIKFADGTVVEKESKHGSPSPSWQFYDSNQDGEYDSIYINDSNNSDGEEFYITYRTEGDFIAENRQKVRAGTTTATIE